MKFFKLYLGCIMYIAIASDHISLVNGNSFNNSKPSSSYQTGHSFNDGKFYLLIIVLKFIFKLIKIISLFEFNFLIYFLKNLLD